MSSRAELPERLRPGTRVPTNPILSMSACLPPTYSTTWINFLLSFPSKITPSLPTSQHATLNQDVSLGLAYCVVFFFFFPFHATCNSRGNYVPWRWHTEWLTPYFLMNFIFSLSLDIFSFLLFHFIISLGDIRNTTRTVSICKRVRTLALPFASMFAKSHAVS